MIKKVFLDDFDINKVSEQIQIFLSEFEMPVIIITGPTSSGKTDLAHNLSQLYNSRLISADSRQIYKNVDIGSNKPNVIDHIYMDGNITTKVKDSNNEFFYWNLDELNLEKDYSAQNFRDDTRKMINIIHKQNMLPIIVGGSIHWIKSLISENISPYYISNKEIYEQLCNKSIDELQTLFIEIYKDRNLINESDWNNQRRLSRYIEYYKITSHSLFESTRHIKDENNYLIFQKNINRDEHRKKINLSIRGRINNGWIEEVTDIKNNFNNSEKIFDKLGQGYRIIYNYINEGKKLDSENLIELISIAEMRYAKKQIL